jgi:hypothetical protein
MAEHFDPNIPAKAENDPCIEGDFTGPVVVLEKPALGQGNLVIDRTKPFDIKVGWRMFGNLVPLWLTAMSRQSDKWTVTTYVESQGPGDEKVIASTEVRSSRMRRATRRPSPSRLTACTRPNRTPMRSRASTRSL